MAATDKVFAGSIPEIYDRVMVPLIFEPYALDLAGRIDSIKLPRFAAGPKGAVAIEGLKRRGVAMPADIFIPNRDERLRLLAAKAGAEGFEALSSGEARAVKGKIARTLKTPVRPRSQNVSKRRQKEQKLEG